MTDVTIVGGGLAGMVAALRLLEAGCQVTLFEANDCLGGKARATKNGNDFDEHGYHIFPTWYRNTWHLVDELGIRDNFLDRTNFKQLKAGEFPTFTTLTNIGSVQYLWQNLTSGVLPFVDMCLFFYATLDLMSQPLRRSAFLDQIAVSGFIHSCFYRTERVAKEFQELMLKGISVPCYFVSAKTMQSVMQYWIKYSSPMHRILRGNLQEYFIDPIQRKLQELGCNIYTTQHLEGIQQEGLRVTKLRFRDQMKTYEKEVDKVILAIPAEKLADLLDDGMYAAPGLFNVRYIRTQPMAALDMYLTRRYAGLPEDHVNLMDSKFGLSFIDVSQIWQGYNTTVLNIIASDFTTLETLSSEDAVTQIVDEIRRYLPGLEWSDIKKTNFQSNINEPLFMNDVGVWQYRPKAKTELTNLYLAGDYCRSHIDLVCMEGAITTGLQAAKALLEDADIKHNVDILKPNVYPRWLLVLGRLVFLPLVALLKLVSLISEKR